MLETLNQLLKISHSHGILRRYFVVNGFDGALTMLGLLIGFRLGGAGDSALLISACVGAAVALGVSGVTSAYISEAAERQRELAELERAMVTDLAASAHALAARYVPFVIAAVNGFAPLLVSLVIILPLLIDSWGIGLPWPPLDTTLVTAFIVIFLLGVFLGRVSGRFWLWTGVRAVLVAALTAGLLWLLA